MFEALHRERCTAAEAQLQAASAEHEGRERALRNYIRHLEAELQGSREEKDESKSELDAVKDQLEASKLELCEVKSEMDDAKKKVKEMETTVKQKEDEIKGAREAMMKAASDAKIETRESLVTLDRERKKSINLVSDINKHKRIYQIYRTLTGTTLENISDTSFDCTVANHGAQKASQLRLTTISSDVTVNEGPKRSKPTPDKAVICTMRCEPLVHPEHLPDFLRQIIEFESSQCPELMYNVMKSMFPED